MTRLLLAILLTVASAFSPSARAVSPDTRWEQIETEHFKIVFDSRHYQLAALYARYAEQAWALTSPIFGIWPQKTLLVIDDTSDLANGFATGIPYPMIGSFPVLPTSLDSISDYGNWGLELLTHEYVHILNFEPATGVMRPLRWMFGNIVRPNVLLPRWYSEGLAVELETRLSTFGRLRSPNYLSIIRSMVEEETLWNEGLARINETSIPDWPGGVRPYLMGALLWNELIRQGGEGIVKDLNLAYSRRVPFAINGPLQGVLGIDYTKILDKTYERAETNAQKQISAIKAAGTVNETALEQKGFFSHTPVISPDGTKLVFIGRDHNVDGLVMMSERGADSKDSFASQKPKRLFEADGMNRLVWTRDSKSLIYDSVETFDRYYLFSDLWRYDLESKKKTKLTKGLRAREPVVSFDGASIVFVQNTPGSTALASVKSDGTGLSTLVVPPIQTRIARPEFLSENEIIFTEKRDDGAEVFKTIKVTREADGTLKAEGEPRLVLTDFKPVHFPRLTPEGLLFISDRSGVANLYLADRDLKAARAVTNTTTRVMTGEYDARTGDLLYSRLTSSGPKIHAATKAEWSKAPAQPPQVGPLVDTEWPRVKAPEVSVEANREPYQAWPHLLPRYWLPWFFLVPDGAYVSATTSAQDPVGRHAYALVAAYDSLTSRPSFAGQYTNSTTRVPITVMGEDVNEYIYSGGYNRHSSAAAVSGSFFLPGLSNKWRGALGARRLQSEIFNRSFERGGAQAALLYNNVSRRGLEISPERGGSFQVSHGHYFPNWGRIEYEETDVRSSYFFSKWLPERHAIALFGNAYLAPRIPTNFLGRSSIAGNYQTSFLQPGFLMRGYGSGAFIGRNIVSGTAEYRFPLAYPYQGWGTAPFFVQKWHGAIFLDAISLDGLSYDTEQKSYRVEKLGRVYYGTGGEVRIDSTIFYHIPVQLIFGAYYGLNRELNRYGVSPFFGLGF